MTHNMNSIQLNDLGQIDYDLSLRLQLEERQKVKDGQSGGTIFFLEHNPPVITLGRNALSSNMLFPRKLLENKGYHVRAVSRGGDITVHEPGQLVIYFVMPLKAKAVRNFVDSVVNVLLSCIKEDFNLDAEFDDQKPGLWIKGKKLCSIGFDLTQKVSMHGIALNVCNTLEGFSLIVPCGLSGVKMTTIKLELNEEITIGQVKQKLLNRYKLMLSLTS